jgi:hypothetical protein
MKTGHLALAFAVLSASAGAQVSGFVQFRGAHRMGSEEPCSLQGCGTMVAESLAEVSVEHRLSTQSALSLRAEAVNDTVSSEQRVGLREGTFAWQPTRNVDVKIGRQVITWGVSDYLFVNDIFPKNYDAFFTGASFDRFKEPVDAAHLTWHSDAEVEVVISRSKADRIPDPLRFFATGVAATAVPVEAAHEPRADLAVKVSKQWAGWDLAAYAASLGSREPRIFVDEAGLLRSEQPRVRHLGVSATGNAASGVLWMEGAVRHVDDNGERVVDRQFLGSTAKFIVGYSREIAGETTASAQVQLESALARNRYVQSLAPGVRPVPPFNPVLHLRVQGHWHNGTVGAGAQLFAGAEGDTHFNPFVSWTPVDGWTLDAGANVFAGRPDTRFGSLRRDSNIYARVRYSF